MPGKQNADPLPNATYAGFAASAPGVAASRPSPPPGHAPGQARTYSRAELRRPRARRGLAPLVATGTALAAIVVLGGGLAYALFGPMAGGPLTLLQQHDRVELPPIAAGPQIPLLAPEPTPAIDPASPTPPPVVLAEATPREALAPTLVRQETPRRVAASKPKPSGSSACGPDCEDAPPFAALDQELNKAFADAIRAGAPAGELGEKQENWIIRQDRIRRDDPALAEDLYRARIAELQALSAHHEELPSSDP
jgi:uncharacterized protein YecT (DUF1311 family)